MNGVERGLKRLLPVETSGTKKSAAFAEDGNAYRPRDSRHFAKVCSLNVDGR
jgi:hypothetical protein